MKLGGRHGLVRDSLDGCNQGEAITNTTNRKLSHHPHLEHMDKSASKNDARANTFAKHDHERGDAASRPVNGEEGNRSSESGSYKHSEYTAHVNRKRKVSRILVRAGVRRRCVKKNLRAAERRRGSRPFSSYATVLRAPAAGDALH